MSYINHFYREDYEWDKPFEKMANLLNEEYQTKFKDYQIVNKCNLCVFNYDGKCYNTKCEIKNSFINSYNNGTLPNYVWLGRSISKEERPLIIIK